LKQIKIQVFNQNLLLNPLKAIYWADKMILLISDLHLGKAGHFRKAGIPIPKDVHHDDYKRILALYNYYRPEKILILGDLFHSDLNREWDEFISFIDQLSGTSIELVRGNHDILEVKKYINLKLHSESIPIDPFIFSHKPLKKGSFEGLYNICGHVHPAISVKTGLRQRARLDCFYFSPETGILPAFGKFTGTYRVKIRRGDRVFAIADDEVIEIKN
jgi:DNA ligase-associated metallophosphoesterase